METNLRQKYAPILRQLTARVDQASKDWALKGDERALTEYTMLVAEICEIKQAIKDSEERS